MEKHIAVYVRVSTAQQNTQSQEDELRRWAESQDGPLVWYTDKASGKSMHRPGWTKLWADVLAGKIKAVTVWRLDRLGRTASGLTKLFEELQARKINLVSLRDGIDLSTAAGRLIANVIASVAQYETEVRADRVRAGIAAARKRGKTWGGSRKGRRLKVTPEHESYIAKASADGTTISEMARVCGLSRPTVRRLVNEGQRAAASE